MAEKTNIEEFKVPIVRHSVSDQVAERILELVRNRTVRAGDQLPTERDLAAALHVSRPSVRKTSAAQSAYTSLNGARSSVLGRKGIF